MSAENEICQLAFDVLGDTKTTPEAERRRAILAKYIKAERDGVAAEAWSIIDAVVEGQLSDYPMPPMPTPIVIIGSEHEQVLGEYYIGAQLEFGGAKDMTGSRTPNYSRFSGISYYAIPKDPSGFQGLDSYGFFTGPGQLTEGKGKYLRTEPLRQRQIDESPTSSELARVRRIRADVKKVRQVMSPRG